MATTKKRIRSDEQVKQEVREHYGAFAQRSVGCCGGDALVEGEQATVTLLYDTSQTEGLPDDALMAAAGCGNPTALGSLKEGETVVDFGSGGGIDCFMAGRAVGPTGRVVGIDMTQDMIDLANKNAAKLSAENVEFHLSEMEDTPLESSTVDVVISNCVICLAPDKGSVFGEAFRILKPGGRLYVSDMILTKPLPEDFDPSSDSWVSCAGGAEDRSVYMARLENAGFDEAEVISEVSYDHDEIPNLASLSYVAYKPA